MLRRALATLMFLAGLGAIVAYAVVVILADDRGDATDSFASLCAIGLVAILIGGLMFAGAQWPTRNIWIPPFYIGLLIFGVAVGTGVLTTRIDRAVWLTPLLAVLAVIGIGLTFLRIAVAWQPGNRIEIAASTGSGVWGLLASPLIAAVFEGVLALSIIGAISAGLYIHHHDLAVNDQIRGIFDDLGTVDSSNLPDIFTTPTVAMAMFLMIAIGAPLIEELAKGLGVIVSLRTRTVITEKSIFFAGVGAGLGFAVVEALGYSLVSPSDWPLIMAVRAPVVIIHVAGTTLFAAGWYRQLQVGGFNLGCFYGAAVLLHAAWNGLFVAVLLVTASVDDPNKPESVATIVTLMLVGALGAVFLAAVAWVVASARHIARHEHPETQLDNQPEPKWSRLEPDPGIS